MEVLNKLEVDAMLSEGASSIDPSAKTDENATDNGMKKPMTPDVAKALRRRTKKNLSRQSSKDGTLGIAGAPNFIAPQRRWKNSRRSRNGQGSRLTKKAGGGRGNWGKMGEFLEDLEIDHDDPNFNEDEDIENTKLEEIPCATMSQEEDFLKAFQIVLLEYFENGDTHEVAQDLDKSLSQGTLRPLVVRKAIEMAFEHKNSHREMTSVLLSDLYSRVLIASDYEKGFDMLLNNLTDLVLDTPDAPHLLGNFIARAVADDCLMPKYVHQLAPKGHSPKNGDKNGFDKIEEPYKGSGRTLNEHAQLALGYAEGHLSLHNGWAHLDNIWGVAGGLRPVKNITKQMELLLKEYLLSRDVKEAQRCIIALEVPHFHHELVYELVIMTMEALNEGIEEAMGILLKSLEQSCIVTIEMIEQGFQRVFDDIQDISLDIPLAFIVLERFVQRCYNLAVVTEKLLKNLPTRGRKRFASEGDSGLIKPSAMMIRDF